MDNSTGDVEGQSPEDIPLPESEDENATALSRKGTNEDLNEDGTGTTRPKRTKKPTFKVINNKLVETENRLEDQWKRCLNQIKMVHTGSVRRRNSKGNKRD